MFDLRNIRVAHVHDDPLGKVFGVSAFSRSQISALIKTKIKPVRRSGRIGIRQPRRI